MRRIGLLILTAAVIAGCGSGSSGAAKTATPTEIAGQVRVHDGGEWVKNCRHFFAEANDDIAEGTTLTIKNAAGTVVGVTQLGAASQAGSNFIDGTCNFRFETSVPASNFYSVSVGSHAGTTVPRAKADDISLTFGSS